MLGPAAQCFRGIPGAGAPLGTAAHWALLPPQCLPSAIVSFAVSRSNINSVSGPSCTPCRQGGVLLGTWAPSKLGAPARVSRVTRNGRASCPSALAGHPHPQVLGSVRIFGDLEFRCHLSSLSCAKKEPFPPCLSDSQLPDIVCFHICHHHYLLDLVWVQTHSEPIGNKCESRGWCGLHVPAMTSCVGLCSHGVAGMLLAEAEMGGESLLRLLRILLMFLKKIIE